MAGEVTYINRQYVSIQQYLHYAYRGVFFENYNFYEYVSIVSVMPRSTKSSRRSNAGPSHPSNIQENCASFEEDEAAEVGSDVNGEKQTHTRFFFDSRHPMHKTHVQMIRSALAVPIMAGKQPPRLRVPKDWEDSKWLKKAEICAHYYLTLFVPWSLETLVPIVDVFSYLGFQQMCNTMKSPNASFIQKCRYASINVMATPIDEEHLKRKMFNMWRGRNATRWKDGESVREARQDGALDIDGPSEDMLLEGDDADPTALIAAILNYSSGKSRGRERANNYVKHQLLEVQRLCNRFAATGLTSDENPNTTILQNISYIESYSSDQIADVIDSLNKDATVDEDAPDEEHEDENQDEEEKTQDDFIPTFFNRSQTVDASGLAGLGDDQNRAFTYILSHMRSLLRGQQVDQLRLIIHGGPGSGKSHLSRAIYDRIKSSLHEMLCVAPTGVAASLLIGGQTIHSLLGIHPLKAGNKFLKKLKSEKLIVLRQKFIDCILLLIDEASMLDGVLLCHISTRLQQIMNNDLPFGGLAVVLVGDFFQLKPVNADPFYAAAMKVLPDNYIGTPYGVGKELITHYLSASCTPRKQYHPFPRYHQHDQPWNHNSSSYQYFYLSNISEQSTPIKQIYSLEIFYSIDIL
jgi:hypothetical protein